jgi:hypothetical protein
MKRRPSSSARSDELKAFRQRYVCDFIVSYGGQDCSLVDDLAQEFFRVCPTNIASVTTDDSHYPEQNVTELTGLVTSAGGSLLFSLVFSDSIQSHVTQGMALWTLQWRRDALQVEGKVIGSPVLGSL